MLYVISVVFCVSYNMSFPVCVFYIMYMPCCKYSVCHSPCIVVIINNEAEIYLSYDTLVLETSLLCFQYLGQLINPYHAPCNTHALMVIRELNTCP